MSKSILAKKGFRLVFFTGWGIVIADHTVVLYFLGQHWPNALADSLISTAPLILCSLVQINTLRFYLPGARQYINLFGICLFLTVTWFLLVRWLLTTIPDVTESYRALLHHSWPIRFSIAFLLLGSVTLISMLWYSQLEQKEKEERKADSEKLAREAELFKLRQQLQPHFLFNSLNSINALIGIQPQQARKMIQQLSDFLRGTLKREETQWIKLEEELQYLQLYLDIEKVRFGNRLATEVSTDPATLSMQVPALLLQPVVENAIKFGLYDTTGDTRIVIATKKEAEDLVVSIANPFDPETSFPRQGTGFGLKSIGRRLYLLLARTDLLKTSAANNIFTTEIRIPQDVMRG